MLRRIHKGFTLIEVMIVVAILAILSAVAIPAYKYYITRGNRANARTAIQNTAQQEERYFTQNNTYLSVPAGSTTTSGWVNYVGNTYATRTHDLTVTVVAGSTTLANSFTISAAPTNGFSDALCGTISLTSTGLQSPSTPTDCWQR
jgi:type IV pilus assembly protein PilE